MEEQIVFFSYVKDKLKSVLYCRPRARFLFKGFKKTTYGALVSDRVIGVIIISVILNATLMSSTQVFRSSVLKFRKAVLLTLNSSPFLLMAIRMFWHPRTLL